MAQDIELLTKLLKEMKQANGVNSQSFDRLLDNVSDKLDIIEKNPQACSLIKAYLNSIAKCLSDKYSTTISNFHAIQDAIEAIFSTNEEFAAAEEASLKKFKKSMSKVYSDARQKKVLISEIETKLDVISDESVDKEVILSTIETVKEDLKKVNSNFKTMVDHVSSDTKTVLSKVSDGGVSASEQIADVKNALGEIVKYFETVDNRDSNLEVLLSNVATNEELKVAQNVIDTIINKTTEIQNKIAVLADKKDIESLQSATGLMVKKSENAVTVELFSQLSEKTDALAGQTEEVKQTLAKVTKNMESLPDTKLLESELHALFDKLESLNEDFVRTNIQDNLSEFSAKIGTLSDELSTISNIVADINEAVSSKIIQAIEEVSFENETYDIKTHVSKMLAMLPQRDDIERILDNTEHHQMTMEEIVKKADELTNKIDILPSRDDIAVVNSNQLKVSDKLEQLADKEDVKSLAGRADEIESMINKLNFDVEIERLYGKTVSVEDWFKNSKIKENTEEIVSQISEKAQQKELLEVLMTTEKIASGLEELATDVDMKKVNTTVDNVYSLIEDLKNNFLNTVDSHNDTVVGQLSELQKSISQVTTVEDFDNFVEGLKSLVETTVETNSNIANNLAEIKKYEQEILEKLNNIDTSAIEEAINKQAVAAGKKLTSMSEYLTNLSNTNKSEIQASISEVIELLQNKHSNLEDIENNNAEIILNIEKYVNELKNVLEAADVAIDKKLEQELSALEENLLSHSKTNKQMLENVLSMLGEFKSVLEEDKQYSQQELDNSMSEISDIKSQIQALAESFKALNYEKESKEDDASNFVAEKLDEIVSDLGLISVNVDNQIEKGFAYSAELVEEKTAAVLELIKTLRHENSENIDLYERLTVADNRLIDFKQELELISTDVISNLNSKAEELLQEIAPIKQQLEELTSNNVSIQNNQVKEQLEVVHDSVQDDLLECTKYSKSTYDRLESIYDQITDGLSSTENNLRDFILSDIDSVIIKIDELRTDLDDTLNKIAPPEASAMSEFREFVEQINEFKQGQKDLILDAAEDIKTSISEKVTAQHEELKSILALSLNSEDIINAINSLKRCIKSKIKDLKQAQGEMEELESDELGTNQYERIFEGSKNAQIIEELKADFDKFSKVINELSEENPEITEILESIQNRMDNLSIVKTSDIAVEIVEDGEETTSSDFYDEDEDLIIGTNNFDIMKALDLLKQDIQSIHTDVDKFISREEQEKASARLKAIPTVNNDSLLLNISNKLEKLSNEVKKDWLEEVKSYISGSEIHSMLEEISGKIDILTLSDSQGLITEIKQSLENLNLNELPTVTSSHDKIQASLNAINEKIDILAATDDYAIMEDLRDTLERIEESSSGGANENLLKSISDSIEKIANNSSDKTEDMLNSITASIEKLSDSEKTEQLLNTLNEKVDIIAATDNTNSFEDILDALDSIDTKLDNDESQQQIAADIYDIKDTLESIDTRLEDDNSQQQVATNLDDIKYTLLNVDEKVDGVKKLSEADAKITAILETLNHKIDILAEDESMRTKDDVEDVKFLILAQMDYLEKLEKNEKTEAVKKCLKELTLEVNNLNTSDNTKKIQKTLKDMKESIMAAVVTIFEQVSFIEEAEDIKDFVEERTDEINQNLTTVTRQLKQITNAGDGQDYTYSMQDIESDLAKLRLALNNVQESEQEIQAKRLSFILDNINDIAIAVEELQDSITNEEMLGLKLKFEKINSDIKNLNVITNQLLQKSGESYQALNSGLEDFSKNLTQQLGTKVDTVTSLLEKSNASDKVMRQALIYMGEWIDSASESMNRISTNSEEIIDVKSAINELKTSIPEQNDILSSLEEKFDEQQERLKFFEKQISKLGNLEDRFEQQQERIDRLELSLEKILTAVEEIDDTRVTKKIDKIDKQLAKLSINIEKLASYVD